MLNRFRSCYFPICFISSLGITWYAPLLYAGATVYFFDASTFQLLSAGGLYSPIGAEGIFEVLLF